MKAEDKYINYLNEIMQDHWGNNKSIYTEDGEETPEWKKVDRMNHKIMWIVREYFEEKREEREIKKTNKMWDIAVKYVAKICLK